MSAKGKMSGDGFIHEIDGGYMFDGEPDFRDALQARFDRYIIADDVVLTDVTDETCQFHVVGPALPSSSLAHLNPVSSNRLGIPGFDIFVSSAQKDEVAQILKSTYATGTASDFEQIRIEQGYPRYGVDMSEDTIPHEAGLEERAISYHKGCYIGQEVISRIKSVGKVNWVWSGFLTDGTEVPTGEAKIMLDDREVAIITTWMRSPSLEKVIALGYVKREYTTQGTVFTHQGMNLTLTPLPFIKR